MHRLWAVARTQGFHVRCTLLFMLTSYFTGVGTRNHRHLVACIHQVSLWSMAWCMALVVSTGHCECGLWTCTTLPRTCGRVWAVWRHGGVRSALPFSTDSSMQSAASTGLQVSWQWHTCHVTCIVEQHLQQLPCWYVLLYNINTPVC